MTYHEIREAMIVSGDAVPRRDCRIAFHSLTFEQQLPLIVEHTAEQLHAADLILGTFWQKRTAENGAPPANKVWRVMVERHCGLRDFATIGNLFPQLKGRPTAEQSRGRPDLTPPEKLSFYLAGLYEFWAEKFYAFDAAGQISYSSVSASAARFFSARQTGAIDEKTSLPGLGAHLYGYANFLAQHAGELIIR